MPSSGEVRNTASPDIFTEDYSAAVDCIGLLDYVDRDRIGAVGICGLSGMAITAAGTDTRIKAVATLSMYDMSRDMSRGHMDYYTKEQRMKIKQYLSEQRWRDAESGAYALGNHEIGFDEAGNPLTAAMEIPEELPEGADPVFAAFFQYYAKRARHPRAVNFVSSWTATMPVSFWNFPLMTNIKEVSPRPILLVAGENAHSRYYSEGSFVKDVSREQVILSTKFTPQIASDSPETMQEMLDGSKARLHADVMDAYWIHNPMDVEKWTPKLIPLAQSGQIKTIGVSNHNLAEIKRANEILGAAGLKVSAVQNHFSLLHRSSERAGILDYCKENGITFYAYMVLEQGALSGKYDTAHPFPEGSDRARCYGPVLPQLEKLIEKMRQIGGKYDASPAQVAAAWAIAKGTLPIIGVTKVEQVEAAAKAAEIVLTAEEVSELETLGDAANINTLREWEKEM